MREYDFYTIPDGIHFGRHKMTLKQAEAYAEQYHLRFEE